MADELGLPGIPEASPEDPEDVSWALSTAEAMWARGDHLEGIKWVRRAAEAASEAERDERALHLAKAAADLSGMLTRRSAVASHELDSPPPPPAVLGGSGRPAVPLPSKIGQAGKGSPAPRPNLGGPSGGSSGVRAPAAPKPIEKKGKRRSRENLENEARAAAAMGSTSPSLDAPPASVTNPGGPPVLGSADDTAQVPILNRARVARSAPPPAEPSREELTSSDLGSAEYWDASPTQNLTSDELGAIGVGKRSEPPRSADSDRNTVIGAPPSVKPVSFRPPSANAGANANASGKSSGSMRPPASTQHDPAIRTSQAVRVVVWRDASGVHIAPEGRGKIAALTIDAVLVALDPAADLTAWLSQRD